MTRPHVVVLSNRRDFAIDPVVHTLVERDVRVSRFNAEDVSVSPAPLLSIDRLDVDQPFLLLRRQFETPYEGRSLEQYDDILVQRAQWRVWAEAIESWAHVAVNPTSNARRAENKVLQLRTAHRLGFRVPETFVVNDVSQVPLHSRYVVKSLNSAYFEGSSQSFVFTTELTGGLREAPSAEWNAQPMIVQRLIESGINARVVAFGERSFGAVVRSSELDWRLERDQQWDAWDVPTPIHDACLAYLDSFGLLYGAFDFVIDGSTAWFLEANQAGEWWFIERACGLGMLDAYSTFLVANATA